jgi:hypothetical protein
MKDLPVYRVVRLITRCGCTREMDYGEEAFPPSLSVPLTMTRMDQVLAMDDATLLHLFADEKHHRVFARQHVERLGPGKVVGVYIERGET